MGKEVRPWSGGLGYMLMASTWRAGVSGLLAEVPSILPEALRNYISYCFVSWLRVDAGSTVEAPSGWAEPIPSI